MKSLKIAFAPKSELILPLAHFDILQGLFYKLLSYDKEVADLVHEGRMHAGSGYKYCCFTDIDGKRRVDGRNLIFRGMLEWQIRAMDDSIIDTIYSALRSNRVFSIADTECDVVKLEVSRQEIYSGQVTVTMDTPLTLYTTDADGYNHFRGPSDEDFRTLAERNLKNKYKEYYGLLTAPEIAFRPVCAEECRKCVTKFKGIYITGYYGTYEIESTPDVVNLAYYAGIGSKNTQGFGTVRSIKGETL